MPAVAGRRSLWIVAGLLPYPFDAFARGGSGHSWDDIGPAIAFVIAIGMCWFAGFGLTMIRTPKDALLVLAIFVVPLGLILLIATKPFYPLALCGAAAIGAGMGLWASYTWPRKHR